jgi:hypothetical protein
MTTLPAPVRPTGRLRDPLSLLRRHRVAAYSRSPTGGVFHRISNLGFVLVTAKTVGPDHAAGPMGARDHDGARPTSQAKEE